MKKDKVIILRSGLLGDTVVAIPALAAIRAKHPKARIEYIYEHSKLAKFIKAPHVIKPFGIVDHFSSFKGQANCLETILSRLWLFIRLFLLRPNAVYILESPPSRSKVRFAKAVCKNHAVYYENALANPPLLKQKIHKSLLDITKSNESDSLLRSLSNRIPPSKKIKIWIKENGLSPNRPLLIVAPGTNMQAKDWGQDNYIKTLNLVHRTIQCNVLLIGGPHDREICQRIAVSTENSLNAAGHFDIGETFALLKEGTIFFGNDSGPMHMAALMNITCVAVFSARDVPQKWEPMGENHQIFRYDPPCSGCMLKTCNTIGHPCLTSISPDEVSRSLVNLLHSMDTPKTNTK
ncbi:glycosyltransferase family 9 protein [Pelagicoccus enzymogenes]|uniref:glycosyltransferase family 9 protein n=1 Tax=Pelagicoccus enzymogenes TaxID=2773457 RepID=UPI00280DAA4B|nr:glycosyltransferase family 9 protein [Pelagicoccus enzymogenes]MDQ8199780.1 glycosyltransferase family 9 protein [Pelagicoccus enzymogenes]